MASKAKETQGFVRDIDQVFVRWMEQGIAKDGDQVYHDSAVGTRNYLLSRLLNAILDTKQNAANQMVVIEQEIDDIAKKDPDADVTKQVTQYQRQQGRFDYAARLAESGEALYTELTGREFTRYAAGAQVKRVTAADFKKRA